MSNSNDVLTYLKEESTYGTAATGNYATLRITGETLKTVLATQASDELGSRRVKDVARTDRKVEGQINARWSYKNTDELFRGALCAADVAAWSTVITSVVDATNTLSCPATPNTIKWGGASPQSWTALGYAVGDWIRVKGFTTNGSEFRCRITAIANGTATNDLATVDHFTTATESGITSGEVEKGGTITDGSTEHFYSMERRYSDLASNFRMFTGLEVGSLNISCRANGLAEISASMLGKLETFASSTGAGTPTAAQTGRLINGIDHVRAVLIDGTEFSMSEWSIAIQNNLRERNVFGELGPESIGRGQFGTVISMNAYYANNTNLAKLLAFTDTSSAFEVLDASGNSYIIHCPAGNFTYGSATPEGNNTDVRQPLVFTSKESSTYSYQTRIVRWDV